MLMTMARCREAVESSPGHDRGTSEDLSQFGKGFVGVIVLAVLFGTVAGDLGEHCPADLIEAEIVDFVGDQQLWLGEHFHGGGPPVLFEGITETTYN
jgi:hypothetical protein